VDVADADEVVGVDDAIGSKCCVPVGVIGSRSAVESVEIAADSECNRCRENNYVAAHDLAMRDIAWTRRDHSASEYPADDCPDPPSCQEADDPNEDVVAQTEIGIGELVELEIVKVFWTDRVRNLIMQNPITPSDQCPDEHVLDHDAKIVEGNLWDQ